MKHIFVILVFSVCIYSSCKSDSDNLIAKNPIDFEQIQAIGNNRVFKIVADSFYFKSLLMAFENKSEPTLPMPNAFAFDAKGKEIQFGSCYATLSNELKRLVLDSLNYCLPYYVYMINQDGKVNVSLKKRLTLHDFLQEKEILLLDNTRLDETMLPKTDYYLFVDYFFWAIEDIGDSLIQLDSMAYEYKDKVTCVLVHTTKF